MESAGGTHAKGVAPPDNKCGALECMTGLIGGLYPAEQREYARWHRGVAGMYLQVHYY